MPLVEYSSSEDDQDDHCSNAKSGTSAETSKKRKRTENEQVKQILPPLPAEFHGLFVTAPRTHPSDDPMLHGGRSRQVPHIEGNWPTHIYLECGSSGESRMMLKTNLPGYPQRRKLEILGSIVQQANTNDQVQSLVQSELGAQLPLHVSLSAPLMLRADQRYEFEAAVASKILQSGVEEVQVSIQRLRWERNYDRSRWFLVLEVVSPANDELDRLLQACNTCALDFDLPLLYAKGDGVRERRSDAFHISIAWQLTEPLCDVSISSSDIAALGTLEFDAVKLKMGNVVKDIRLSTK